MKWWMCSIMSNFFIELFRSFKWSIDHLTEYGFFFFEISELVLEVVVFLLLTEHTHFELSVQGLNQRHGGVCDLIIGIENFSLQGLKILPE